MFYAVLKGYARGAIHLYCKKVRTNRPDVLRQNGPLLLAANHPNSFLDGMILTTLFDARVYSLARGDAFRQKWADRLLRRLQLLPVYRTSEGAENLGQNYTTFAACRQTFERQGVVLIFSEGRCENEWHLRPLRKGTARLALTSWQQGIPLTVIPTAFNYSSFGKFGKEVHLVFGEPIQRDRVEAEPTEGKKLLAFNAQLQKSLETLVYEIPPDDSEKRRRLFRIGWKPGLVPLLPFAALGWLAHAPLYYSVRLFAIRFRGTGHYDSVLTALLLLLYPLYLALTAFLSLHYLGLPGLAILLVLPVLARACVLVKYGLDR